MKCPCCRGNLEDVYDQMLYCETCSSVWQERRGKLIPVCQHCLSADAVVYHTADSWLCFNCGMLMGRDPEQGIVIRWAPPQYRMRGGDGKTLSNT
jgi:hypothetical protein